MKTKFDTLFESLLRKISIVAMAGIPCTVVKLPKNIDSKDFERFLYEEGLAFYSENDSIVVPTAQYRVFSALIKESKL